MMIHNFLDCIIVHVNVNAFSKSLHAFVRIPSSLVVSAFDTGDETSWFHACLGLGPENYPCPPS